MARLGVGRQLHVPSRVESSVGHLHHPRFRIARAHPRLFVADLLSLLSTPRLPRRFRLLLLQLRQLRDRLLQPLLLLLGRTPPRRSLPRRQGRRIFRTLQLPPQLLDVLLRLRQQLLQTLFPAKTPRPRTHPHSVLAHPAHRHQFLVHQRRDHLREQLIQRPPVVAAEIRQQPMIHRHPAAQPAERRALLTPPRQLPRRSDPANTPVQPQPHQQSRIRGVATGHSSRALIGSAKRDTSSVSTSAITIRTGCFQVDEWYRSTGTLPGFVARNIGKYKVRKLSNGETHANTV